MDENYIQYKNDPKKWDCTREKLNYKNFNDYNKFDPNNFNKFMKDEFKQFQDKKQKPQNDLDIQQMFVPRYTNTYFTENENTFGNILLYHSVGSGKTCTSIIIGELYHAAFKHTKNKVPKIIIATPKSVRQSFIKEILGTETFKCTKQLQSNNNFGSDGDGMTIFEQNFEALKEKEKSETEEQLKEKWNIITHHQLIQHLFHSNTGLFFTHGDISNKLNEGGNLIIIDEIQNLISTSGGQLYSKLLLALQSFGKKNRIVLLSATPIYNHPVELGLIMNLLNPRLYFPTTTKQFDETFENNENLFKYMTSGYVSYYSGNPENFPTKRIIYQTHELSQNQIDKINNIKDKKNNVIQLQKYYNIDVPSLFDLTLKNCDILQKYSPKIFDLLKSIDKQEGKIFIYSDMLTHGLYPITSFLKQYFNYEELQQEQKISKYKKRFILWTGQSDEKEKHKLLELFNKDNNKDGKCIKILLGSNSIMEGISLKAVRHVHILNPWWNESRIEQVIGRAVRQNSHKQLLPEKQFVNIYRHISYQEGFEFEKNKQDTAEEKKKNSSKYEKWLKEIAVDCFIYKNQEHNKIRLEEHIKEYGKSSYYQCIFNPSTRCFSPPTTLSEVQFQETIKKIPEKKGIENENIKCSSQISENKRNINIPKNIREISDKKIKFAPALTDYMLNLNTNSNQKQFVKKALESLFMNSDLCINNINVPSKNRSEKLIMKNNIITKIIRITSETESENLKRIRRENLNNRDLPELEFVHDLFVNSQKKII